MNALVQAIYQRIPTINIDLNTSATAIKRNEDQTFTVTAVNNRTEEERTYDASFRFIAVALVLRSILIVGMRW